MGAGRPEEYKAEYVDAVEAYIQDCQDKEWDWVKVQAKTMTTWEHRVKVKLPTHEGFALYIGVSVKSLYNWADQHPEFLQALGRILAVQKEKLTAGSLSGDYNPMIAKLILSANHGMREKSDVTTDGKALPTPIYGGRSIQGHDSNEKDIQPEETN